MIAPGRFQPPSRQAVIYGEEIATALPRLMKEFWASRAVIATNASLSGADGLATKVARSLGEGFVEVVSGIRAGSPREDVMRVAGVLRGTGIEVVIAIGGGSVVDVVKTARICLTNNVRDAADMDRLRTVTTAASPRPYLIAIPTTLSGAEFTQFASVADERAGLQDTFHHPDLAPDAVILDSNATIATPETLWASGGARALVHAIETWCARSPSPYSDATALYGFRELARWLPESTPRHGGLDARLACQVASWMAIQGAAVGVSQGASAGIADALSAVAGVDHGEASAILLPHVLRYNLAASRERQEALTRAVGRPLEPLADIVAEIVAGLRLPAAMRDVGVVRSRLPAIARAAWADRRVRTNIREIEDEVALLKILEAAF
jgi:maleylacetate reductase